MNPHTNTDVAVVPPGPGAHHTVTTSSYPGGPSKVDDRIDDYDSSASAVDSPGLLTGSGAGPLVYLRLPDGGFVPLRAARLPTLIGMVQLGFGFLTALCALLEIVILPLAFSQHHHRNYPLGITAANCFGAGLWAGVAMVLAGASGVRVVLSRRATSLRKFYLASLASLAIHTAALVTFALDYAYGWSTDAATAGTEEYYRTVLSLHTLTAVTVLIGLLLAVTVFAQYWRDCLAGPFGPFWCLLPPRRPLVPPRTTYHNLGYVQQAPAPGTTTAE